MLMSKPKIYISTTFLDLQERRAALARELEKTGCFDVESREYNGRWYTDVKAWKVLGKQQGSSGPGNSSYSPPASNSSMSSADDDDLPF